MKNEATPDRTSIQIRTEQRAVEIAWFSALCSDDYEYLGVPDGRLRSSFEHCSDIVLTVDRIQAAARAADIKLERQDWYAWWTASKETSVP